MCSRAFTAPNYILLPKIFLQTIFGRDVCSKKNGRKRLFKKNVENVSAKIAFGRNFSSGIFW